MNGSDRQTILCRAAPWRGALLFAACFRLLCTPALADACAPPRLVNTVKLEPLGDLGEVAAPIVLHGVEKKFLFDTGGGMEDYVSDATAHELGLTVFSSPPATGLRGNVSESAVRVRDVAFGAVKTGNVPFQIASNLPYDGILSAGRMAFDRRQAKALADLDMDFG